MGNDELLSDANIGSGKEQKDRSGSAQSRAPKVTQSSCYFICGQRGHGSFYTVVEGSNIQIPKPTVHKDHSRSLLKIQIPGLFLRPHKLETLGLEP